MKFFKIILSIFIVSFLLNFLWEFLQTPFYACFMDSLKSYYWPHIRATLGDSLYTIIIYLLISVFNKDLLWMIHKRFNWNNVMISIFIGIIIAVLVEFNLVYLSHAWSYSTTMPKIYGIGLIPMIQMVILPIITFCSLKFIR